VTESGAAAPNGAYTFEVSAVQGGQKVAVDNLALAKVVSVSLDTAGMMLNTDALGSVDMTKVKQIF
jgi:flagellar basal-body rod modification protein FlgD